MDRKKKLFTLLFLNTNLMQKIKIIINLLIIELSTTLYFIMDGYLGR